MSAGELLGIDPLELIFPCKPPALWLLSQKFHLFQVVYISVSKFDGLVVVISFIRQVALNRHISRSLQLSNKTDDFVAFKVKTTSPKKYCVRPNAGIVLPRSICDVVVTMQPQSEAPPDMQQPKDKFLIQSVITSSTTAVKDITQEMFSKDSGNKVDEVRLRVTYVFPQQPPSPVPEESGEGTPSRHSPSEDGNMIMREFYSASKEQGEPEEKTSEAMTLVLKLTDEKNLAIQQSNKLRQELELMRREVSRQRSGFSFLHMMIVALLGVLLGYFVKK